MYDVFIYYIYMSCLKKIVVKWMLVCWLAISSLFTYSFAQESVENTDIWDIQFNQKEYQEKIIKDLVQSKHYAIILEEIQKEFQISDFFQFLDTIEKNEKGKQILLSVIEKKLDQRKYFDSYQTVLEELNKIKENKREQEFIDQLQITWKRSLILEEFRYTENISNWFSKWWCTWYAAILAFNWNQSPWLWNANQWFSNAKRTWYETSKTPEVNSLITFKWHWYSDLGHVWYVREVLNDVLIIEDMNAKHEKFLVTKRVIKKSDPAIEWFIYL